MGDFRNLRVLGKLSLLAVAATCLWSGVVAAAPASPLPVSEGTTRALHAYYFENYNGKFLSIQARDPGAGSSDTITAGWWLDPTGFIRNLSRYQDAGVYIRHQGLFQVTARPDEVTVQRNGSNWSRIEVEDWAEPVAPRPGSYESGFNDGYVDTRQIDERIADLAAEFPEISELVTMPHQTDGYQRKAQIVVGFTPQGTIEAPEGADQGRSIVLTSKSWSHEGGSSITVSISSPGTANSPLSVSVSGNAITVSLATGPDSQATSTAAQIVDAISASPQASALITASTFRGNSGAGIPVLTTDPVQLVDTLHTTPAVSRGPQTMRVLRISSRRDGSRPGVLIYAGPNARAWAGPLVALELAEQLLRNYGSDPETTSFVDGLDIFILPTINPDGLLYSRHLDAGQRKNMRAACPLDGRSDPASQSSWGIDLNRNFSVGSVFDGYSGASTNCTSETYAGPSELSEPETKNLAWLANSFPGIAFAAEVGSYGGHILQPPGAYIASGRQTLPRPPVDQLGLFDLIAKRIVSRTTRTRQSVILPDRVGPMTDFLYSGAGNAMDYLYYAHGIFAQVVNVGIDRHSGSGWTQVGFAPDFGTEGGPSSVEFADGLTGLLEVAQEWGEDQEPPEVTIDPPAGVFSQPLRFRFVADEPARIHYTLDGSQPSESSPVWEPADPLSGLEEIDVSDTATVRWIAIDVKGNQAAERSATYVLPAAEIELAVSPAQLDFGSREVGSTTEPLTVEVRNRGWGTATIDGVNLDGAGAAAFSVEADGCTDAALDFDEGCEITVAYRPEAPGPSTARLTIRAGGGGAEATVDLAGVGMAKAPVGPEPQPPLPEPMPLLGKVSANTRCIGNPRLARTKRDLRVGLYLQADARVSFRLQQRLPLRARQPRACPKQTVKPNKRPRFRNLVPVRAAPSGKIRLRRANRTVAFKAGQRQVAALHRLGLRRLATGHYRLVITARDAEGRASGQATLHFRVLQR